MRVESPFRLTPRTLPVGGALGYQDVVTGTGSQGSGMLWKLSASGHPIAPKGDGAGDQLKHKHVTASHACGGGGSPWRSQPRIELWRRRSPTVGTEEEWWAPDPARILTADGGAAVDKLAWVLAGVSRYDHTSTTSSMLVGWGNQHRRLLGLQHMANGGRYDPIAAWRMASWIHREASSTTCSRVRSSSRSWAPASRLAASRSCTERA